MFGVCIRFPENCRMQRHTHILNTPPTHTLAVAPGSRVGYAGAGASVGAWQRHPSMDMRMGMRTLLGDGWGWR